MINVLHLRDTDRVCGPGKTIIETACATDRSVFHQFVGLYAVRGEASNAYRDACISRGVDVVTIHSAHPYDPRILLTLRRIIRDRRVDIVHSHEYKSDLIAYALARFMRVPIMSTAHGWITNHAKSKAFIRASKAVLPAFDHVVAVSAELASELSDCGVPAGRLTVIHNAIVTERYDTMSLPRGPFRRTNGLEDEAFLVGYIGRLSPEKGQADFLQGMSAIASRHPRLRAVMVGDGPDRPHLEELTRRLGLADRVTFTGHLNDIRPVLRDIDLLALTSHTEGLPNVVLEALCMQVPVLATRVGGVPEILTDGLTGVLIPARTPTAVATALDGLIIHPDEAAEQARKGRKLVLEKFSFRHRVRSEEDVYRRILEARR